MTYNTEEALMIFKQAGEMKRALSSMKYVLKFPKYKKNNKSDQTTKTLKMEIYLYRKTPRHKSIYNVSISN